MLWVDRVGDHCSPAILARHFSENNRDRHNDDETSKHEETGFTRATERQNNDKNGNETMMLNMNRAP
jgi:hypothetical protein